MREHAKLHYLKNVLGIRSFLAPEDYSPVAPQEGLTEIEFFFQTQNQGNVLFLSAFDESESSKFSVDELQLLEKIIVALKLKFSRVDIAQVPRNQIQNSQVLAQTIQDKNYSYVFLLGEKIAGSFHKMKSWLNSEVQIQDVSFFSTFHPQDMLQKPDLKKDAWKGFQAIIENLPR